MKQNRPYPFPFRGMTPLLRCAALVLLQSLLLTACSASGAGHSSSDSASTSAESSAVSSVSSPAPEAADVPWHWEQTPVKLHYDQMWESSAQGDTEDPELLSALVSALQALKVGESSPLSVTDCTDLLTFTFPDGSQSRLEFEGALWVAEDGTHYEVEGLDQVRSLLEQLIKRVD